MYQDPESNQFLTFQSNQIGFPSQAFFSDLISIDASRNDL